METQRDDGYASYWQAFESGRSLRAQPASVRRFNLFGLKIGRAFVLAILAMLVSACAHVQFVAEYDAKTLEETLRISKEVETFYGHLVELPAERRTYAQFASQYIDIGADINSLYQRNAARSLNSESQRITQDILGFWRQYQQKHKSKDAYPDARLDQLRFGRLFTAAVSAEAAKRLDAADGSAEAQK
ncbi:MAG: hypothetical protein QM808_00335 [Steroidobacteraceae bacterium]